MAVTPVQFDFLLSGLTHPTEGTPLNAGTVYFYTSGTSTPKNVYTEVAATNPYTSYTLDAIGVAKLYGDGEYRVVVKDSAGTTLYTWDEVVMQQTDLVGLTASVSEINATCDGNTATAAEITQVCDGNTATAEEIAKTCHGTRYYSMNADLGTTLAAGASATEQTLSLGSVTDGDIIMLTATCGFDSSGSGSTALFSARKSSGTATIIFSGSAMDYASATVYPNVTYTNLSPSVTFIIEVTGSGTLTLGVTFSNDTSIRTYTYETGNQFGMAAFFLVKQ